MVKNWFIPTGGVINQTMPKRWKLVYVYMALTATGGTTHVLHPTAMCVSSRAQKVRGVVLDKSVTFYCTANDQI